jgi:hypothetical protein
MCNERYLKLNLYDGPSYPPTREKETMVDAQDGHCCALGDAGCIGQVIAFSKSQIENNHQPAAPKRDLTGGQLKSRSEIAIRESSAVPHWTVLYPN